MGPLRPYFPKLTSSSGNLRKIVGKGRQGKEEKRGRGGWGMGRKNEGGVGEVSDDVIEKIKN